MEEVTLELQEVATGTSGDRAFQVGGQCREREVAGDGGMFCRESRRLAYRRVVWGR